MTRSPVTIGVAPNDGNRRFALRGAAVLLALAASAAPAATPEWAPKQAPLMTPWAQDVDPANPLPEHPRPLLVRDEWLNLNGVWQFAAAKPGDRPPFGRDLDEAILVPFPWESALSGVRRQLPRRTAWYRRLFSVPPSWRNGRVLLHFGAVDWETQVYVDGQSAGVHRGGYDPFTMDITHLLAGDGEHELVLRVWDPGSDAAIAYGKQNNAAFKEPRRFTYTASSGVWQTVWLERVPRQYVTDLTTVPDVDGRCVRVTAVPSSLAADLRAEAIVLGDGVEVARGEGEANASIRVDLPDQKLWSPNDPHLYDLEVVLKKGGNEVDRVRSYFGQRKIELIAQEQDGRPVQRIALNGEVIFQMGTLDQGYWPDGVYTAPTDAALRWDVEQTKACGFNVIRKHIKVEPQRWYWWCDKLGMLVWQDMPSTFKRRREPDKTQFETELLRMVRTHWNHPSIVNWVVFNEHWGAYDVPRLTALVESLDPTRLVTGNSGYDAGDPDVDYEVGHIRDNHHYRGPAFPPPSHRRASILGEYGAIGYLPGGHVWDEDGPWVHFNYENLSRATAEYEKFAEGVAEYRDTQALCGAVYTQWTDVENEMNGLYTYDRKEAKLDPQRVRAANEAIVNGAKD